MLGPAVDWPSYNNVTLGRQARMTALMQRSSRNRQPDVAKALPWNSALPSACVHTADDRISPQHHRAYKRAATTPYQQ
jgi:hypothetical protein